MAYLRLVLIVIGLAAITAVKSELSFTILHTGDFHAHFGSFDKWGNECSQSKIQQGKCFGGVARLKAVVDSLRRNNSRNEMVFCDAGDQFQGTLWFDVHRASITSHFMNRFGYDVMCTGNHEFDHGEDELIEFSHSISFPLVSANLVQDGVTGKTPPNITKSTVLNINGQLVAFVGYTTKDTALISFPERFKFIDEIEAVKEESAKLKAQNINKIIALGHAGLEVDKKIAEMVPDVDLVIGAHSDTFLYTGPPPDTDEPVGPYPMVINQASGRRVPIIHGYVKGKYLGFLNVTFDDNGELIAWSGNPILLNSDFPEDTEIVTELNSWRGALEDAKATIVGQTRVLLDHSNCRYAECNLGNLIAESQVERFNKNPPGHSWARLSIALVNGGAIRYNLTKGDITLENIFAAQPFGNSIDLIYLQGRHIHEILEFSIEEKFNGGGFLQLAGLRVEYEYNVQSPNMSKVISVQVRCADCLAPAFSPLEMDKYYEVATNNFLINGGDGYSHFLKYGKNITYAGELDITLLSAYLKSYSPVTQGYDGRIIIRNTTTATFTTTTTVTPSVVSCQSGAPALASLNTTQLHMAVTFICSLLFINMTF